MYGGFCYLNNVAIAAKYLLKHCGAKRVAILDVDYHHGNGSEGFFLSPIRQQLTLFPFLLAQQIFYDSAEVLYVSLHAEGDWPCKSPSILGMKIQKVGQLTVDPRSQDFTGSAEERGAGPGLGYNHNFPLPQGRTTDDLYCETLEKAAGVIRNHADVDYLIVRLVWPTCTTTASALAYGIRPVWG